MRKIIYITGITASGKTTTAEKLAEFLGLPFYKADDVYSMIAKELNYPKQEELVMPEKWKDFDKFGLLKLKYYKKLLENEAGDFIIEGFPLFFEQDRQLIKQVVGDHWQTFFRFVLPFNQWQKYAALKFGGSHVKRDFDILNKYFEAPDKYYEITDPAILFQHYETYQRTGFTDEKFNLLGFSYDDVKDKTIIDLGCNAGWIGKYCLSFGAFEVDGVDYNWRYLEEARQAGLNTNLSDLDEFEFKKDYDITICLATFHYVRDKEKLLAKIAQHTKEVFYLEVPITPIIQPVLLLHDTGKCKYFIPSMTLLDYWIKKYFKSYTYWESVAPDNSTRYIFKCLK